VDALVAVERLAGWADAYRARVIASLAASSCNPLDPWFVPNTELAASVTASEVACALMIPERTAVGLIRDSQALVQSFPGMLGALEHGVLSYRRAVVVLREAEGLPAAAVPGFEAELLTVAGGLTGAQLGARALLAAMKNCPWAATKVPTDGR
jgi:hypothetical protein